MPRSRSYMQPQTQQKRKARSQQPTADTLHLSGLSQLPRAGRWAPPCQATNATDDAGTKTSTKTKQHDKAHTIIYVTGETWSPVKHRANPGAPSQSREKLAYPVRQAGLAAQLPELPHLSAFRSGLGAAPSCARMEVDEVWNCGSVACTAPVVRTYKSLPLG